MATRELNLKEIIKKLNSNEELKPFIKEPWIWEGELLYDAIVQHDDSDKTSVKRKCIVDLDGIRDYASTENLVNQIATLIYNFSQKEYIEFKLGSNVSINISEIIIEKLSIDNKKDLFNVISLKDSDDYYFRGENKEYSIPLYSTVNRIAWTQDEYEEKLLTYIQNAKLFQKQGFIKMEEKEAHAQHYGFPTKMVDFTRKIGIALFFAMDHKETINDNSVIFCLPRQISPDYQNADEGEKEANGYFTFYTPDFIDMRIEAQQGLFLRPSHKEVDILNSIPIIKWWLDVNNEINIKKIIIKNDLKEDVKKMLSQMNIDPYTIYQDYNNLSRAIKEGMK